MNMKYLLPLLLLSACAAYSERGTGEGGREIGEKGYTVRCDASPANQPGCYQPALSFDWWPSDRIKLRLGAQ
ncbi:hypothetical protein RRX38_06670 [Pseudomonas sp. DTU_2021_1001937_2_SI_NGA_ILE_001]|uniref:hypothetical protein n=1 Tax=Pseudomonas sp. DTU_2021_1001937_2_SI_NGA_ILE_001 TaxID=3077589 RepID=UPI0028FC2171|nr:hypothetical protein [Pseudomonas sp. DTU_2021_1001937_2_SI_NGA_ILE_001]WNW10849.1 hypothetical protein RRX38_06670 [Pseudomonas sp. DTU_2021_1001937_2_SI_NGA_ILE_001]